MLCSPLIKISNPHCLAESCWLLLITMILLRELGYKTVPLIHMHTHNAWVLIGVKSFQLTLCKAQEMRVQPWMWKTPGGGNSNPLQQFLPVKFMDRGTWPVTVHGVTESDRTERLSMHSQIRQCLFSHQCWMSCSYPFHQHIRNTTPFFFLLSCGIQQTLSLLKNQTYSVTDFKANCRVS